MNSKCTKSRIRSLNHASYNQIIRIRLTANPHGIRTRIAPICGGMFAIDTNEAVIHGNL